ncbi:MAG: thioredoxin family protein [Promethearchaeota archaeon]
MKQDSEGFIHIEFFSAKHCPHCPIVRKMLKELIESELGMHVIIEEIDIHSSIGQERVKFYKNAKGVPAIAIDGKMKFIGVPPPILLFNEVKRLVKGQHKPNPSKPNHIKPPQFPKKSDDELSFYT